MTAQRDYHITRRPDGQWQYKLPGAQRASGVTNTQAQAEAAAKESARNGGAGGEITIHRPNGQIRDRDTISPANDPTPPVDKVH
tara:strand:+ start:12590 stop:12841 length:252 start_codon:yes stop_codon:yes gene_type:complete